MKKEIENWLTVLWKVEEEMENWQKGMTGRR